MPYRLRFPLTLGLGNTLGYAQISPWTRTQTHGHVHMNQLSLRTIRRFTRLPKDFTELNVDTLLLCYYC